MRGVLHRVACAVALTLLAAGGSIAQINSAPAPSSALPLSPPSNRILVMPFDNAAGEGRTYWLREAASVLLSEDLKAAGAEPITRAERLRVFERLGVPMHASLSNATVIKLGELLGATTVVVGSFSLEGDRLKVNAHSIRLDTGRIQAVIEEWAPLPELFRLFDRIVVRLFPLMSAPVGHSERDHAPLPAFENYIKGLIAEVPQTQVEFLLRALKEFPAYDAARLALWQVYSGQGEHAKALAIASEVSPKSSDWAHARLLAALSHIRLRQYDQAFTVLQSLNEQAPSPQVFNDLGVVQLRRGATAGGTASYFFNKARELDGGDSDYAFNLGYAYVFERDLQAAIYWLREAVRRNPSDGDAHYVLGAALVASGAVMEGNREKELARRLSSTYAEWDRRPASDPVPRGLERLKDSLQRPTAGATEFAFESAGQKDQQALARYHLEAGRRLFQQDHDREAADELKRAIYLSPYQAEAHLLLGQINLRNGRVQQAIGDLKISLWSEESVAAHIALAEAYLQAKDTASARSEVQRALAMDPKSADAKKLMDRIGSAR